MSGLNKVLLLIVARLKIAPELGRSCGAEMVGADVIVVEGL
jgi:hypothetical protein